MAVYFVSGAVSAIKGGYVLLAVILATLVFALVIDRHDHKRIEPLEVWSRDGASVPVAWTTRFEKFLYIVAFSCITAVTIGIERRWIILVGVPLGYVLLGTQLVLGADVRSALSQTIALFLVSPVTKYLAAGFYFGATDTLIHLRYVDQLLSTGATNAFPEYQYFPALHINTGILSAISGISTYDSLMIMGLVAFTAYLLAVYAFAVVATGRRTVALFVVLGASVLDPVSYFATYFFPQSLGVVLFTLILYTTTRPGHRDAEQRAIIVASFVLGIGLVVTHHLTFVLVAPIIGIHIVTQWRAIPDALSKRGIHVSNLPQLHWLVLVAIGMLAVTYWTFTGVFIKQFVTAVSVLLDSTLFASETGKPIPTYVFGHTYPEMTASIAFQSLFSAEGIYYVVLTAMFIIGVLVLINGNGDYRRPLGVMSLGLVSAGVILRTPLAINGLERARLPFALFFAFIIGVGLHRLFAIVGSASTGSPRSSAFTKATVVALLISLGTTGALTAGDDLYQVHSGPDLYENAPLPEPQQEFSLREYQSMEATSGFINEYARSERITTLAVTRRVLFRFGTDAEGRISIRDEGIRTQSGLFVYRERWSDHRVTFSRSRLSTSSITMSERWLDAAVTSQNKVYTTGEVGALWTEAETVIRSNRSQQQ